MILKFVNSLVYLCIYILVYVCFWLLDSVLVSNIGEKKVRIIVMWYIMYLYMILDIVFLSNGGY